jgi:flagellar biosynthesis/type III secretory pathway protein FliH
VSNYIADALADLRNVLNLEALPEEVEAIINSLVENEREEAYDDGHTDGYSEGEDFAYSEGYDNGRSEGYDEGHADGYDEGFEEGKEAAEDDAA